MQSPSSCREIEATGSGCVGIYQNIRRPLQTMVVATFTTKNASVDISKGVHTGSSFFMSANSGGNVALCRVEGPIHIERVLCFTVAHLTKTRCR